jgi:hypothetical protein
MGCSPTAATCCTSAAPDRRIADSKGQGAARHGPAPLDESARTLEARNAFVMGTLLQEVTRSGTAASAQRPLKRPTSTARPAPPTTRWTPGSPATTPGHGGRLDRLRHAAQARRPRDRRRPGAAGVDRPHAGGAQGRARCRSRNAPPGVVQQGRAVVYDEFANGGGVRSLGLDQTVPGPQRAKSATASSTCSGAERRRAAAQPGGRKRSGRPPCADARPTARSKNSLPSRVSTQRPASQR